MNKNMIIGIIWLISGAGVTLLALSERDWVERLVVYYGGDPISDGRILRFFIICLGIFIVPALLILILKP